MDVSIIIINYNTCRMTSECIDSVVNQTKSIDYEIILVDNASTDGSKEFFEKDNRVKYIYCNENRGFGAGNNIGVKHATGKYLFLLNSDTLLKNNAVKLFFDYAETHNQNCVYGGWLIDREGNPTCSQFVFPRMNYWQFIKSFFIKPLKEDRNNIMNVDAVVGADMFLTKTVYEAACGFDENIFMYGEETELQYRLMRKGIKRIIIPQPQIVHFGGASTNKSEFKINTRSHYYFLKKHMPKYMYYSARIYYGINYIIRWAIKPSNTSMLNHAFLKL